MPKLRRAASSGVGAIGTIRNFSNVLREISFDEVRDEAQTLPWFLVVGPTAEDGRELATLLTGLPDPPGVTVVPLGEIPADLRLYDAIVVYDPAQTGAVARIRSGLMGDEAPYVIAFTGINLADEDAAAAVRQAITNRLVNRAPAFGRAYPAFRTAATHAVIDETAKANAQFALIANVPSIVPVVGSLASAGADFLVLTKNQLMLIFKIAAIYGRDLHDQVGIFAELVPVVGAGLLWRTIAREAVSFIPLAAGTIPKVAIAYAGTVASGRGAEVYYRSGKKPTRAQLREFSRQAMEAAKRLPIARGEVKHSPVTPVSEDRDTQPLPPNPTANGVETGITERTE